VVAAAAMFFGSLSLGQREIQDVTVKPIPRISAKLAVTVRQTFILLASM
jgi:hypothetical protein